MIYCGILDLMIAAYFCGKLETWFVLIALMSGITKIIEGRREIIETTQEAYESRKADFSKHTGETIKRP